MQNSEYAVQIDELPLSIICNTHWSVIFFCLLDFFFSIIIIIIIIIFNRVDHSISNILYIPI